MTQFNVGEVVYVKSTEEPVIVFGVRKFEDADVKNFPTHVAIPELVTVRRPIVTENGGTHYKLFDFAPFELETGKEQSQRLYAKIKERQALAMSDVDPSLMEMSAKKLSTH